MITTKDATRTQAQVQQSATDARPVPAWPSARMVVASNLSEAWLEAYKVLTHAGGTAVNLMVAMPGQEYEVPRIRQALEQVMEERGEAPGAIETVANTIFPNDLHMPHLGTKAAAHLYEVYGETYPLLRTYQKNRRGTYFGRLIAWEHAGETPVNQLDRVIARLRKEVVNPGPKSSAYELSIADAAEVSADLRIQQPGDTQVMGFPRLSHISLTLVQGRLYMSALYRNQYFIKKAYGNYLGLTRLLNFVCSEVGCVPGDIAVWATHADGELSRRAAQALIQACESAPVTAER